MSTALPLTGTLWQRSRGRNSETELNGFPLFFFLGATITGEWQSADCTDGCDEIAKKERGSRSTRLSLLYGTHSVHLPLGV